MTAIVLAVALVLASPHPEDADRRAADRIQIVEARAAARFNFLSTKRHTRAEVLARAGQPEVAYDTFVEEGLLDPDPVPPWPGSVRAAKALAATRGRSLVEVEVFEYDLGEGRFAMVVLRAGAVAYAVHPSSPSISTREQIESLYGAGEWRTIDRAEGDHRDAAVIVVYPALGIGFAEDQDGKLTRKLVWTPAR